MKRANHLPETVYERGQPVRLATVALGLTLYLDDPLLWGRSAAGAALQSFLRHAPAPSLKWFTTSLIGDWRKVEPEHLSELVELVSSPLLPRPRHQFRFRLVDDAGAPGVGFSYREVDAERRRRAGVLEVQLPPDHPPDDFLALALELAQQGPFFSGVAGYQVSWNEYQKSSAFWWAYRWSRRYLGLDIQDPDAMAWAATDALPGSNWLTLVGDKLAAQHKLDFEALRQRRWKSEVTVSQVNGGIAVQAGSSPTLGDSNQLEFPTAYAAVAAALADLFVEEPPEFWGGFVENKLTLPWLRRLLEPLGWQ